MPTFAQLALRDELLAATAAAGYQVPTTIQRLAIPRILAGQDLIAIAQTGTGKTAAFVLPILQLLAGAPQLEHPGPQALILTPTRELALQVGAQVASYGQGLGLRSLVVHGGVSYDAQQAALAAGVAIVVATPGRLRDLLEQRSLDLAALRVLVLDEADRMLDMGFIEDVAAIIAATPGERQTLLFSATFAAPVAQLAQRYLRRPQSVQATPEQLTASRVTHSVLPVDAERKAALLQHLLRAHPDGRVLVFVRTKQRADELARAITDAGHFCMATHSGRTQAYRTKAMACFHDGRIRVLVGTDMVARGLDIDDLGLVINYEIPNVAADYVHRIGRTGRGGAAGLALSLVSQAEAHLLAPIEALLGAPIDQEIVPGFAPAKPLRTVATTPPSPPPPPPRWGMSAGKSTKKRRK